MVFLLFGLRRAEEALFLKDLPVVAAPSVFVRPQLDHAASILGAPVNYTPVPEVGSIAPAPAKPEPAQRLTEILKNEPATEALLLTQVVANDPVAEEEETEITTAHAKPVSRFDFEPRIAPRRSDPIIEKKVWFAFPTTKPMSKGVDQRLHKQRVRSQIKFPSLADLGLTALMLFGLTLLALGVALLVTGTGNIAEWAGAGALGAPGLAAVAMAAFGFWRAPKQSEPAPQL
jgi:hypothetical protein